MAVGRFCQPVRRADRKLGSPPNRLPLDGVLQCAANGSLAVHSVTRAYGNLVVIVAALQLVAVAARTPAGSPPSALEAASC